MRLVSKIIAIAGIGLFAWDLTFAFLANDSPTGGYGHRLGVLSGGLLMLSGIWLYFASQRKAIAEPLDTSSSISIRDLYLGIFLISSATLLLELTLTRIFDVVLWNNLAYLIISGAIFGFGLGGVFIMLFPMREIATGRLLTLGSVIFAGLSLLLVPILKFVPANFDDISRHPFAQLVAFGSLYLSLLAPFFISGLIISIILTRQVRQVHQLYFWDLVGAGTGCLAIFVLPTIIGAEETLVVVGAVSLLAAAVFAGERKLARQRLALAAVGLGVVTFGLIANRISFPNFIAKRGITQETEREEFSRWDPISKIDIIGEDAPFRKRVVYDGGSQSSAFFAFDGDYEALTRNYFDIVDGENRYNSGKYVAISHWLKRSDSPRTLVIGSAGGQETLAALAFGAARVDAVEMVCTVIDAATGPYSDFTGALFSDPRVKPVCDEGRSFLRQSNNRYDIIQIHSNHTVSSVANGSGGASPIYLQTVEAYKEYFSHLSENGILQINYFVYPRMITTSAEAWSEVFPREEFSRHLVITTGYGSMPTFLVKRSPWTSDEIAAIRYFLSPAIPDPKAYKIVYAPGEPEASNVPVDFFKVPLDPQFQAAVPYKVFPLTDDRPFFRDLRKNLVRLEPDSEGYTPPETAEFINASLRRFVPLENLHLYVLGGLSIIVASVVILVPLLIFRRRDLGRVHTVPALIYFSCLGAGFIIVELVLIFKFSLLIGFPVYSMATVLFTLLVSAGIGSYFSEYLSRRWGGRTIVLAVIAFGFAILSFVLLFPLLRDITLGMNQLARILLAVLFIIPIGIPLGMPFPLGMSELKSSAPNLVPWAWGVNGFMTVVGSLMSILLSMKFGFDLTIFVAVGFYVVAIVSFYFLARNGGPAQGVGDLR